MLAKVIGSKSPRHRSLKRLVTYISNPDKAELVWSTNCDADSIRLATIEMGLIQKLNTRSKAEKTYHLVISFDELDRPSSVQLRAVEEAACKLLGLEDHQRIVAYHTDTKNPHIHLAINLVHPEKYTVHTPYRAFHSLDLLCAKLEKELGFTPGPRTGKGDPGLPREMERHGGIESFGSWLQKTVKEPLLDVLQKDSATWNSLHELLARYQVELRKRGNGLVFASLSKPFFEVKASAVSRSFSIKNLERNLGAFTPSLPSHQSQKGDDEVSYSDERLKGEERGSLYQQYLSEREQNTEQRRSKLSELRESYSRELTEVRLRYNERRKKVQSSPGSNTQKRAAYSLLRAERLAERQRQWDAYRKARVAAFHAHPTPTWIEFIRSRAEQGNLEALLLLRKRNASQHRTGEGLFSDADDKPCVFRDYKYSVNKTGEVTYFLTGDGGGQVKDCSSMVKFVSGDDRAIEVTILLAMERFGRRLELQGTEEFKRRVVEVAAREGLGVTFANRDMEALRRNLETTQGDIRGNRRTRRL